MKAEDILCLLDEHIEPGAEIDNFYQEIADTRLTVFRSEEYWAIFFEFVGNHITYVDAANYIYAYGNCLKNLGYLGPEASLALFATPEDKPLTGEDPYWIADKANFSVIIKGYRYDFSPTEDDYRAAGLILEGSGPGSLPLSALLRFLCHHLNHPFFACEDYLRYLLNNYDARKKLDDFIGHKMQLFFQTRQWQHVSHGKKPSQLQYFQCLAKAIETGDLSLLNQIDPAIFNTDWRKIEAKLIKEGWRDNMEVLHEGDQIFIVYKAST
ncbi:MAG: hypothetical protein HZLCBSQH_001577 [Candidatus Fervidibacterota bacterium]